MKQVWGNGEHATALTVAEMRAADAYTIAHFTPGRELMRRAAEGVYGAVAWHGRTAILAGGGNNGGDGYALAGILAAAGMPPVMLTGSCQPITTRRKSKCKRLLSARRSA